MAANRALALEARDRLLAASGGRASAVVPQPVPAPDAMIGSMAAVALPGLRTDEDAERLHRVLFEEDRIEVPIVPWPVPGARTTPTDPPRSVLVRVSAQRYNESSDIDMLVSALERRLTAA